ncbi:MAG TPA: CGNR zinc finger domain-containing protein [Pseudonocardiaceae bacterium]|nr:CGNR zinc finger domain-containing protein [Pseudonocardiaceae bacterium]
MTGLVAGAHAGQESGWQPVYRPPAGGPDPGELDRDVDLVLAFLNTLDTEEGTDLLGDETRWRDWARGSGLDEPGDRAHARGVRDALRACLTDRTLAEGLPPIDGAHPLGSAVRIELAAGLPVLVGGDALGAVLAAGARLAVLGQWDRLKICAAGECRWAFYDRSRNRSRTWCSMRVCGNRTKARNWRQRTRGATPVTAAAG